MERNQVTIETVEGREIGEDDVPLTDRDCNKNPGHKEFIEYGKLETHHLPEFYRSEEMLKTIQNLGKRVVRLRFERTDSGPGFVVQDDKNNLMIQTTSLLIRNKQDVKNCSVIFTTPGRNNVVTCRGENLVFANDRIILFTFHPTPDFLPDEMVKCEGKIEVKVEVSITCKLGTGYVVVVNERIIVIETNNHVVGSEEEAKQCIVDFNYNSFNSPDLFVSRGQNLLYTCPLRDVTSFTFSPIPECYRNHDLKVVLGQDLNVYYKDGRVDRYVFVSSMRNAISSYFTKVDLNDSDIHHVNITHSGSGGTERQLASRYITFHPIPEHIESFNHPLIESEQDDGTNSVIEGEVILSFASPVVLVHKPLTKEEARKCKISFPNDVISYGMNIYFEHQDSSQFFINMCRGIDYEDRIEEFPNGVFFLDMKPEIEVGDTSQAENRSRLIQRSMLMGCNPGEATSMCAIGHPHGGIKMVSFGHLLKYTEDRFDEKYSLVDASKEGRDVTCINYSCPTCPGSSGSPVVFLATHDVHVNHFLSRVNDQKTPVNINMAWAPIPAGLSRLFNQVMEKLVTK